MAGIIDLPNVKETVIIQQLTSGIVVTVGCHSIAIEEGRIGEAMSDVTRLLLEGRVESLWKKYFPEDFLRKDEVARISRNRDPVEGSVAPGFMNRPLGV